MASQPRPMEFAEFEEAYTAIAEAIDRVGPQNEKLFLAKLVLVLAKMTGQPQVINDAIVIASANLQITPPDN